MNLTVHQRRALERLAAGDTVDVFEGSWMAPSQRWRPRGAKGPTLAALIRRGLVRWHQIDGPDGSTRDWFTLTPEGRAVLQ